MTTLLSKDYSLQGPVFPFSWGWGGGDHHGKCPKGGDQITWLFLGDVHEFSSTSFLREDVLGITNSHCPLPNPTPWAVEKISKTILQIHLISSAWKIEEKDHANVRNISYIQKASYQNKTVMVRCNLTML